jgi:ribosomal protein S18 acetylase RimI-like enzyme
MEKSRQGSSGTNFSLRRARQRESVELAALMDVASGGLASRIWRNLSGTDASPAEIGRARIRDMKGLPSHFSNWFVIARDAEICGACAGYMLPDPYDAGDLAGVPEAYAPVLELEALATGSWYLMSLAVYPEFRRQGFGTALLARAEQVAHKSGAPRIALTASSKNEAALSLYALAGYSEMARRSRDPSGRIGLEGEWLLLAKNLLMKPG